MVRLVPVATLLLFTLACAQPPPVEGDPPPLELVQITTLTTDGGRIDWSPDGVWIAFDRMGDDGKWDLWQMRADGSDAECLSCGHPDLGDGDIGQPAWHPSGDWLAFQAESPDQDNGHMPTMPGAGVFNDLVVMRMSDRAVFMLNDVRDGSDGTNGGTLHPVFNHAGTQILWTDYETGCWTCPVGDWQIALADFVIDDDGVPSLQGRTDYQPGESGLWYETHGFGPDDSWIYFSANTEGQPFLSADLIRMDLATAPAITRLTETSGINGEYWAYDEHAKLDPTGTAMMWLNDESGISEYWLANPDGSGRFQVTDFNTEGHPHFDLVDGLRSVPSDNAWNPEAPEGTAEALGFIQVDFNATQNSAPLNHIVKLTFARTD